MKRSIFASALLSLLAAANTAAQSAPPAIFSALESAVASRALSAMAVSPKGVSDRQLVGMRIDRLFDSTASRVLLNVDGREWIAVFGRVDADIQGHRAWVGSIEGIEYSHVSFAERDGVVSGVIDAVTETFALRTVAPGIYALDRVAQRGGELEPIIPPPSGAGEDSSPAATANDDGSLIDVMLLYTPGARAAVGGTAQMNAMVAQIISDTNTIFARSGIVPRVRLVGSAEAALPETTNMSADLSSLRTNPSVAAARDAVGADLVQLIMNSGDGSACGIGYLLNSTAVPNTTFPGYSITDYSCVSGYTPTHEMGHNMGSHHAPEDGASGALFSYSYGYKDPARGFRTVMAYSCTTGSCPRIANFSNPGVNHVGFPTGTAGQNNALSVNNARMAVSNFRQARSGGETPPGAPTGLTSVVSGLNATLSWNPVLADVTWAFSAATGYVLQVGSAPGVYNLLTVPVGNTTSVSGSAPAGTYYWRVIGSNGAGLGTPSAEAQFTLGGCAAPGPPLNLTHSVAPGRLVTLNWAPPATGTGPFAYTIDVGTASGLTNVLSAPVGGTTGLSVTAPPGTFFVRIRAANACAPTSLPSNEQTIVVP